MSGCFSLTRFIVKEAIGNKKNKNGKKDKDFVAFALFAFFASNRIRKPKLMLLALGITALAFIVASKRQANAFSSGPPPSQTGAPGEGTCVSCHTSFPLNSGGGTFTIDGIPASYSPDQEVAVTITLTQTNRARFGFQATVVDEAGRMAGTLVITDPVRTQTVVGSVGGGRTYINHTLSGSSPSATNQGSWTFRWRAPAANAGRVTFYAAGNAANGNGSTGGDFIYTAVLITTAADPGFEGDVAPRGNTNGAVTIIDWVQVGRFAAGLDVAGEGTEFQRADCAPRETLGDGKITIADWVQAGRYAAGLDPPAPAGGPTRPISSAKALQDER
jgi:hypothetical protein